MSTPESATSESSSGSPPRQLSAELLAGVILLAIVAVFLGKAGEGSLDWLFPRVLSYTLGALAVVMVVRGLLGFGERVPIVPPILRGQGIDVLVFTLIAIAYVVLARPVGFWLLSTATIVVASVYLAVGRTVREVVVSIVVALSVAVVGFLLLTRVFYVPLPRARWWPF